MSNRKDQDNDDEHEEYDDNNKLDIEEIAKSFRTSMKGIGTDEDRIIREVVHLTNIERQAVKKKYMALYGQDLESDLKSELSGLFRDAVLGLFMPPEEYEAKCMYDCIAPVGTDVPQCIAILCNKDPAEIKALKAAYQHLYKKDLDQAIKHEYKGDMERIFRALLSGGRAENHGFDQAKVRKEAQELYDASEGKLGTDEDVFIRILCSRSMPQLTAIFQQYALISNKSGIEHAIASEMSGDLRTACLTLVQCARNRLLYFAEQINGALKKNNDRELVRLLVSRSSVDLPQIKAEFQKAFGRSMYDVASKALNKGDTRSLVLALIGKH